ncbi:hypothetical protein ACLF3G_05755 [Falsiroseomonas sp. HC035]|uniref:hypothetical protein n=1 Tax=Falsiroseomonas sp. HC035 TaxID=3390999 RepID=UPI003D317277
MKFCNHAAKARGAHLATAAAPALLLAATLGLGLAQLVPRPGQPVALLFSPGLGQDAALRQILAQPGWDPVAVRQIGPFTLALVAPAALALPGQPGHSLPAAAWLVLAAPGLPPCLATPLPIT